MPRRAFLATAAAAASAATPLAVAAPRKPAPPIGLELYSVREALKKDLEGTVTAVARMGYQGVEFYSPYLDWTADQARRMRKLLDDLGIRCFSTHNSARAFAPENLGKAAEFNTILGSKYVIMASAGGKVEGLDGWKQVAARLTAGAETLRPSGLRAGFHNHKTEFVPIGDKRPMDLLAENTPKDVVLQLDIGTCIDAGSDPVEWIRKNPGRIVSIHCKDWARGTDPEKGYRVLLGEGEAPWKKIAAAATASGGLEYYLVEQEGSRLSEFETAEKCLHAFRKLVRS